MHLFPCNYEYVDDLWIVSCYFNPYGYISRRRNFDIFYENLKASKIKHIIVECSENDDKFHLPLSPDILRVRKKHVIWQKERLLNIAISNLPDKCRKVAWLDCDILFTTPLWAIE